jgi:peptidylprolyl isomerase
MPLIIHSPYSGRPVKVRDEDVGRAIRDEEGRVFYVVPRAGEGYYAAPTRKGSAKDEARYDEMAGKMQQAEKASTDERSGRLRGFRGHDATGRRRTAPIRLLALLMIVAALAAGGYFAWQWWQGQPAGFPLQLPIAPDPAAPTPAPSPTAPAAPPAGRTPDDTGNLALAHAAPPRAQLPGPTVAAIEAAARRDDDSLAPDPFVHADLGLRYRIDKLAPRSNPVARVNDVVAVHYRASIEGGDVFDDQFATENHVFTFRIGGGEVIRGLDQGVVGMRTGEIRTLIIPPLLAYGSRGAGTLVPPDATLRFEVELLAIEP